jgi:hypothetical protein
LGLLTPMHRFLQLEPSWLRKGQTTSLFESVIEKDEVRADDLGGILETPPCAVIVKELWRGCRDDSCR